MTVVRPVRLGGGGRWPANSGGGGCRGLASAIPGASDNCRSYQKKNPVPNTAAIWASQMKTKNFQNNLPTPGLSRQSRISW